MYYLKIVVFFFVGLFLFMYIAGLVTFVIGIINEGEFITWMLESKLYITINLIFMVLSGPLFVWFYLTHVNRYRKWFNFSAVIILVPTLFPFFLNVWK